jgi:hypothetical protein
VFRPRIGRASIQRRDRFSTFSRWTSRRASSQDDEGERYLFLALDHASNQAKAPWKLVIVLVDGNETEQRRIIAPVCAASPLVADSLATRPRRGGRCNSRNRKPSKV